MYFNKIDLEISVRWLLKRFVIFTIFTLCAMVFMNQCKNIFYKTNSIPFTHNIASYITRNIIIPQGQSGKINNRFVLSFRDWLYFVGETGSTDKFNCPGWLEIYFYEYIKTGRLSSNVGTSALNNMQSSDQCKNDIFITAQECFASMRGKKEIPKELYEIYMKNMTLYAFKMYSFIQGKPSRCRDELLNFVGNAIVEDSVRKGKKTMNSMACISILKGFMLSIQVETGTCNKIDEHMAIEEYESVLLGLRDMADDVVDGDIINIIKVMAEYKLKPNSNSGIPGNSGDRLLK